MKKYIGTKVIEAEPMNLGEYNKYRGWEIPKDEDPERDGYRVVYPDDYVSWSPKEIFEEAYKDISDANGLEYKVFPSEEETISVVDDADYHGAHFYQMRNSLGFKDGKAEYVKSIQSIQFVQKNADGTMVPGLQSEQLAYILLDRVKKLNARFPSEQNVKMFTGLQMFLDACRERVQDRIDRRVMGDLKK